MRKETMDLARQSLRIEAEAVADVLAYLDEQTFGAAVDVMVKADRIMTCACGNSGIAAQKLAHSLCCIEKPAKFIPPGEAVHGGLGFIKPGDVAVLASRGGKTAELMPILHVCRVKKVVVVSVTENLESPLARGSDIVLPMRIKTESDKYNVMATSSFMALVGIFDALHIAIMEETGYSLDEFALIHPGGAVGERLNS